jgi:predicted dehydrogenase
MSASSRRKFLRTSAMAGAAAIAAPAIVARAAGANERLRVGLVGMGGRMHSHVGSLATLTEEADMVAVCDCDETKLADVEKSFPDLAGKKLKVYKDQKALFDDKEIDAVSFGTQDHWHALQTIWACQAGKDVYVEKPSTWCIAEGRKMVEAARKYNRMVQIGTQNRSSPNVREGIQKLKEGVIGKLYMGRGMSYKVRDNLGKHRPRPVPAGLNWDAWVGPAQMVEYSSFQHHRWYWLSNFASGDVANQTVHDIDKLRWGLGLDTHPTTVMSMGGRFVPAVGDKPEKNDDADTPNTQAFMCQWAGRNILVTFEVRHWHTNSEAGMRDKYPFMEPASCVGEIFFGSEGYMIIPDYSSYYTFLGANHEPGPCKTHGPIDAAKGYAGTYWKRESAPHFHNWLTAIRSRNYKDLHADVEEGHMSMSVCHMAKISAKLGRSVHFDPKTERFVNDSEADRFLTREYRKPYVVPDQV